MVTATEKENTMTEMTEDFKPWPILSMASAVSGTLN